MGRTRVARVLWVILVCVGTAVVPAASLLANEESSNAVAKLSTFWADLYGQPRQEMLDWAGECPWCFQHQVLAKAQPDECFYEVGDPRNRQSFFSIYPGNLSQATQPCGGQPKVNQAYVWGLVKAGNNLWFGTIANTHCLVISGFLGQTEPNRNSSWVCEGGIKDARPPRAYYYNIKKHVLTEVTAQIIAGGGGPLLLSTIGLRSAGSARGVVFLGGIGRGVNIFAFNAETKAYLGAIAFDGQQGRPLYTNIRQWRTVRGELYVGVAKAGGGEVLRWIGDKSDPFAFQTVGAIAGGDPAYLTPHGGRLFVSTWPSPAPMAIWRSPKLGPDHALTPDDASGWEKVWDISTYEAEPSVIASTGGGALHSHKGYLYWGTMHVPGVSLLLWQQLHPGAPADAARAAILGTYRPISIFRGRNFASKRETVEVLYGNALLPAYSPESGWQLVPNKLGQHPKYGLAGFNNFFNNYTWWMEKYKGQLFVGTMDFLYLGGAFVRDLADIPERVTTAVRQFYGADLWRFCDEDLPGAPVSISGVGNYTNYGIRTMVPTPEALYLGSANPMNLLTDPNDDQPEGGWELIKLTALDSCHQACAEDDDSPLEE